MTRSMFSSIMKLMKNYTMNVRTNFLDSITVESWIKQVSILWYRNLITILKDLELQSISKIHCLFANNWLIFFFYVNDIMIICMKKNTNRMRFFEKSLMKQFEMRILKELKWFLRIKITRNRVNQKIWLF